MDIAKMIDDVVSSRRDEKKRDYIGASIIGRQCERSIWYELNAKEKIEFSPSVLKTFDVGKKLEELLVEYVVATGISIELPSDKNNNLFCQDDEVKELQGHLDALINFSDNEKAVLEIKTAHSASFLTFVREGLKKWSSTYYAQVMSYMGMMKCQHGVLLAMNKDTQELHHEWILFDKGEYESIKSKALRISMAKDEPSRINSSPLYYVCRRCSFKNICHQGD